MYSKISGFRGGDYEDCRNLGGDAVEFYKNKHFGGT
jgi:hypothetical protein